MSAVKMLGLCGLTAAFIGAIGGFFDIPFLIGVSSAIMLFANSYALIKG